jgi:hypothetical protein
VHLLPRHNYQVTRETISFNLNEWYGENDIICHVLQLVTLLLIMMMNVLARVTSLSTSFPLPSEVKAVENINAAK